MSHRHANPMMDRRIIAFDIETRPDPDGGRRVLGLSGEDELVSERMIRERLKQTDGRSDFLKLAFHHVVTVSMAEFDPQTGEFALRSVAGANASEREHIEGFFGRFSESDQSIRLVSWNGEGFDLPVLRYRGMINGISAKGFYQSDSLDHFDLMKVLAGSSRWMGLDEWCQLVRLPGNRLLKSDEVYQHVFSGVADLVQEYCDLDACSTLLAFLLLAFHMGELPRSRLRQSVKTISDELRRQRGEARVALADGLRDWPQLPPE